MASNVIEHTADIRDAHRLELVITLRGVFWLRLGLWLIRLGARIGRIPITVVRETAPDRAAQGGHDG